MACSIIGVHLDLDGAWCEDVLGLPRVDLRAWGPKLRYMAPTRLVEEFCDDVAQRLAPFVLYGSGDFHYLAGLWLRRVNEPVTLVSFDNHPDWDVRPPRWACGGWINRALELPHVRAASVWGCGNFELAMPSRLFANRAALRAGILTVNAWAERFAPAVRKQFDCMTRDNWRQRFEHFAAGVGRVYVTVDLDCLRDQDAVTNWENGLFTSDDIAWAVGLLAARNQIVAGDVCGAWSKPAYARWGQRFAGWWDHPKQVASDPAVARERNARSLSPIWHALTQA